MKRWQVVLAVVAMVAAGSSGYAQEDTRSPAVVAERYQTVASQLDQNGDLFMVLNVESLAQKGMDILEKLIATAPGDEPEAAKAKTVVAKLNTWLRSNGFYGMRAIGISGAPKGDGTHSIKAFISRDPASVDLPLWRAIAGGKPRMLACNNFLPADTAIARTSAAELPQMWNMIRSAVKAIVPEKESVEFDKGIDSVSTALGADFDKLINTIGDEAFFALQLSKDKQVSIPSIGEPMMIPELSFIGGFKANDDSIVKMMDDRLATNGIPVLKSVTGNTEMRTVFLPVPLPIKLQPTYTMYKGYMLMGSSTDAVMEAMSCFDKKNGFMSTPEFKIAFAGLPADKANNGIAYMSERFSSTLKEIQMKNMGPNPSMPYGQGPDAGMMKEIYAIIQGQGGEHGAAVIVNLPQGLLVQANGTSSGRAILMQLSAAPAGMLAAIAIPSFIKARSSARNNGCVNNLRMIDGAKDVWALEYGTTNSATPTVEEISQYLKGNELPVCPQGGIYTINAIGTDPECSIPGHSLQQSMMKRHED